jgi:hypothetical protein
MAYLTTIRNLAGSFASQSTTRVLEIRGELNKARKLDDSAAVFFNKIKT